MVPPMAKSNGMARRISPSEHFQRVREITRQQAPNIIRGYDLGVGDLRQNTHALYTTVLFRRNDVYTSVRHVTKSGHGRRCLSLDELVHVIEIAPNDGIKGVPLAPADFFRETPFTVSLHSAKSAFCSHQRLYGEFQARIRWQDYQASGNSN